MGCWGMGIAQTDEFCEVYDDFMERYDEGKEPAEISEEILAEQHKEFDDSDGVMYDVYFALAKAEWMCGALSEKILGRVTEIIESGANIEFYRELDATESDLKLRKKNLEKFLVTLATPREKPRARKKRRQPPPPQELPPVKAGECYRYKYGEGWRVVIILERDRAKNNVEYVFNCVLRKTFAKEELGNIDFLNEKIGFVSTCNGDCFLSASSIKKIGEISVKPGIKKRFLDIGPMFADRKTFKSLFRFPWETTLGNLIAISDYDEEKPCGFGDYEVGGVYAYEFDGAYRVFGVLDIFHYIGKPELALCAVFSNKYLSFECDFIKESFGPIGTYTANQLEALGKTKKIGEMNLPKKLNEKIYGNSTVLIGYMMSFISNVEYYPPKTLDVIISQAEERYKIDCEFHEKMSKTEYAAAKNSVVVTENMDKNK